MNIGVMGGTFDPIHSGHIMLVEEVKARLNLTKVLFVPAGQPWLKANNNISPAQHRVEMVRLAIADKPDYSLCTLEIERSGPTYTIDTIAELKSQLKTEDELFFILGWDNLTQLPQWKHPGQLIAQCHLVVVPRPGYLRPDLQSLEAIIPGLSQKVIMLDKPEIDISASLIRDRLTRGLPINDLVPVLVDEYIKKYKLYSLKGG
ncbi:MAG: nicotinate-nucleotide adenylyltransferase [Dehalococcoidales bacterium]|nr:nicotinate-nucleotide adenylyltransferase [Dehalococcoidales bacterium]